METNINLGYFLIDNIWCMLIMKIIVSIERAVLSIHLPNNYPRTNVGKTLKMLFEARITKMNNNNIYLNEFRIWPRQLDIPLTESESIMIKGLGRRSLCVGLPIILNYWKLTNNISLILNVESGNIPNYDEKIQWYTNFSKNDLIQMFQNNSGLFSTWREFFNELSEEVLADILIRNEANLKLVDYYKSLGFEIISDDPPQITMGTIIRKFLNLCQNTKSGNSVSFREVLKMIEFNDISGYYFFKISDSPNSLMTIYDKRGNIYTTKVFYNEENNDIHPPI